MSQRWRTWIAVIKVVVAVIVAIGLVSVVRSGVRDLSHSPVRWSTIRWHWLVVSLATYAIGMTLAGLFWHQVLVALGQPVGRARSLGAFFVSQLGKYVPGKAMVIVLRVAMIRAPQVQTPIAVVSVFVETLTWMAVAAAIGSVTLISVAPNQRWLLAAGTCMALVAFSLVSPPVLQLLLWRLRRREIERAGLAATRLPLRVLALGWSEMVLAWMLAAVSLWSVLQAISETPVWFGHYWLLLACTTLSVVLGFVSLIPGGLGVRELVMIPLLSTEFGSGVALTAAVLLRLVWLAAELLLATIMQWRFGGRAFRSPE
jgi:uncharacterized membrane protein YbhN (UPF0104 family)